MTYLYLEHAKRALTNTALYAEQKSWKKSVMYEPQSLNLPKVFKALFYFVAARLESINPEPRARAVVEPEGK